MFFVYFVDSIFHNGTIERKVSTKCTKEETKSRKEGTPKHTNFVVRSQIVIHEMHERRKSKPKGSNLADDEVDDGGEFLADLGDLQSSFGGDLGGFEVEVVVGEGESCFI